MLDVQNYLVSLLFTNSLSELFSYSTLKARQLCSVYFNLSLLYSVRLTEKEILFGCICFGTIYIIRALLPSSGTWHTSFEVEECKGMMSFIN